MATFRRIALSIALSLVAADLAAGQQRVACLGDSITFGARLGDRRHTNYPAQLAQALDLPAGNVRNFGVGGATLLRDADRPYVQTKRFAAAVAWRPDVAIVMLGTNDTCDGPARNNWQHSEHLERDTRFLVEQLLAANPAMDVWLATPSNMRPDQPSLSDARRADLQARRAHLPRIATALRAAAGDPSDRVRFVDLGRTLRTRDVVDGVHPNPFGAERIARRLAAALQMTAPPAMPPIDRLLARLTSRANSKAETKPRSFHGFDGIEYTLPKSKAACRVFAPHTPANGTPWILRARFFGHQPALDIALLERGFHLAWCDVANLYGSDEALRRWDEFYELLQSAGFAKRAVLEGMSRGGLPILNWAAAHPDRVAAIYGDNPVADFRSWPGGQSGKRSDADWQRCLDAYGIDELQVQTFANMPIDRLPSIAKQRIPMLLVLGENDQTVPPHENGERLAQRYRELAGAPASGGASAVTVWRKPGQGHHPHGLSPVDPLLRAILQATGHARMPTTQAKPSVEYRRGAGWNGDTWREQVAKMRALARQHATTRVVLLGDSITQGLTGATERMAVAGGSRAFDRAFGDVGAMALGLSGDRTEHLLWRIREGALRELDPAVIVLQIGVNNVHAARHTANETAAGIRSVLAALARSEPQATVLICGPFPAGTRGSPVRSTLDLVHQQIAPLAADGNPRVDYLDLRGLFLSENGRTNDCMRSDRIHLTAKGAEAWLHAIAQPVRDLLAR
ncbi:MAG: GDSL-type esterase/lipase family protein [Planctomycetota bacterium]